MKTVGHVEPTSVTVRADYIVEVICSAAAGNRDTHHTAYILWRNQFIYFYLRIQRVNILKTEIWVRQFCQDVCSFVDHLNPPPLLTISLSLSPCQGHEMTSIGLLLGVSSAKLGTMDMSITRLLSIHIPALLPPTSTELDVPHNVQVRVSVSGSVHWGIMHVYDWVITWLLVSLCWLCCCKQSHISTRIYSCWHKHGKIIIKFCLCLFCRLLL